MPSSRIMTLAVEEIDLNSLAQDTSPDPTADYAMTYDASAGVNKKVLLNNLGIGRRYKMITSAVSYQNTSNVTPVYTTELDFAVKANRTYRAKWYLAVGAAATTTGVTFTILPSSGTLSGANGINTTRLSSHTINLNSADVGARPISTVYTFASTFSTTIKSLSTIEMTFINTDDANVTLSFTSEVGGSNVSIYRYSCVEYEQLGSYNV